jgi:hypothetical protein
LLHEIWELIPFNSTAWQGKINSHYKAGKSETDKKGGQDKGKRKVNS